ncbi:MAG: SPOR domain-containing protein [bacterium]
MERRILNRKSILIWAVGCALMFNCASSEKVTRPASESEKIKNFELMQEDFDPLTLKEEDIQIDELEQLGARYEDEPVTTDVTIEDSLVTGYRIQLIQTTDPDEAKNVQKEALLRFQDDVYRVFDPPFYKVRVGDYLNWFDAEKIQKLALQKGFREAWVIRTKVNLKKASKWIDEY